MTIELLPLDTEKMTLEEIRGYVDLMYDTKGWSRKASPQTLLIGAVEELGETAMALLLTSTPDFTPSPRKLTDEWADQRDVAAEVGDTITYLLALCNKLDIQPKFKWAKPHAS